MQIRGKWETGQVWIDDRELSPERSQAVVNHSPTGFSWGFGGSGPAQLALALLLELTTKELALLWYQDVKWRLIATLPQADFTPDSHVIVDFIAQATLEDLCGKEPHLAATLGAKAEQTRGERMATRTIEVDFRYSRDQLAALFEAAHTEDVERGGRYDARSGAINVWTHPWTTPDLRAESTMMGSFYFFWGSKTASTRLGWTRASPARTCSRSSVNWKTSPSA